CEVTWAEKESFPRCPRCITYIRDLTSLAGIHCYNLADYIDSAVQAKIASEVDSLTFEQLKGYVWNGLSLGVYAVPATRWRLRAHDIGKHPDGLAVMAGFIRGGAVWASCMEKLLAIFDPDVLVMLNGLFMEERVTWELAKRQGRRTVCFERGRDAGTVFLTHNQSAPRYDVSATWQQARGAPLTEVERKEIMVVMQRRVRGEQLIETYWAAKESDLDRISQQLNLERNVPLAVLFTNVAWDTAMQDRDTIFDGMMDWLRCTIELFEAHPGWMLLIRIHPAETQVPGRESFDRVGEWIRQEFRRLPANIRVVLPGVPADSYALMNFARVGLVYASTMGLELAVTGMPVVVAGAAHYSGKGFTYDPSTREEYAHQVVSLMRGEQPVQRTEQVELALRYAHLFFLRRTFSMTVLDEPAEARPRLSYASLAELMPGRQKALDVICDGIMHGTEFELRRNEGSSAMAGQGSTGHSPMI
ncbi:MAG: hypothetical protein HY581_05700, partial [Nitrospirae bacterium]|nr:hypothetical protein [Nitrospirota bacterium]